MGYIASHGMMRARPAELHPGTLRVISVRMDYLPPQAGFALNLKDPNLGYISRYAGGRDYHKLMRNRLKKLGERIDEALKALQLEGCGFRPFVDSAPILERPLAEKAGIGWTGKHSLLLNHEPAVGFPRRAAGEPAAAHGCRHSRRLQHLRCLHHKLPNRRHSRAYVVDGRRCISYLTIELAGSIPLEFRPLLGNRIYGCDDCQLVCPINRAAPLTAETDFHLRPQLKQPKLLELFAWSEAEFLKNTEGSAIRRIGHERWLRNIAVALGNAPGSETIVAALQERLTDASELVAEHIEWALAQQAEKLSANDTAPIPARKTGRLIRIVEKGLPRDA